MKTVVVDFDGVIHSYSRGWQGGEIYDPPMPGAREGLELLMRDYAVVVLTARRDIRGVAEWIEEHFEVECFPSNFYTFWNDAGSILVTNVKLPAAVYIDDRGLRFTTWDGIDVQVQEVL